MSLSIALLGSIKCSFLAQGNDIRIVDLQLARFDDPLQELRSDVPTLSADHDGDSSLVVTGENADDHGPSFWLECNTVTDLEIKHPLMRPRLMQESQPFDDPIVEVDEFRFGEFVDVNYHPRPSGSNSWVERLSTGL